MTYLHHTNACSYLIRISLFCLLSGLSCITSASQSLSFGETNTEKYGYAFQGVFTNQTTAEFEFTGGTSNVDLSLDTFDIDTATEIDVELNGTVVSNLKRTANNALGSEIISLPLSDQAAGINTLVFRQINPGWKWGISNLLLTESSNIVLQKNVTHTPDYGFNFNGTNNARDKAEFEFAQQTAPLTLTLDGYDIDTGVEISVSVNGQQIGYLARTSNNALGESELSIPANLINTNNNTLTFEQASPGWIWGITNLLLSDASTNQLAIGVINTNQYGYKFNGINSNRESVEFEFENTGQDLSLSLDAFDIDTASEVQVSLNGQSVRYLDTTENNSYGISSLLLESAIMSPGTNSLVFTQSSPGWIWGIENILIEPSPTIALALNTLNAQKYGHAFEGTSNFQESVEFVFPGSANNLLLSLDTYDIDFVDEVAIKLNSNLIGYLNSTDNNAYGESSIIIPAALSLPGDNSLVFEQKNSGWRWGVTNILLSTQAADQPILNNYELVFADEFNGSELDASKWNTGMLWGPYLQINHEKQLYVDTLGINQGFEYSPFELTGNSLKITAVPTTAALAPPTRPAETDPIWDNFDEYRFNGPSDAGPGYRPDDIDYLSGIINSYDSFKMTHGYVEARVKLPVGKGLWPAFWLLNTHYVGDAPEIDVMEFLGDNPSTVYHTYHYFDINNNWSKISTPSFTSTAQDWTHSFHTFGLAWSPNELVWYIDGVETRRITNSDYKISAQAMYLILNLAVGGQWPGDPDATTPFPATFEIDYIRAYKKKLSPDLDLAADYQLMFNDEFDGNSLDTSKWNTAFLWGPYYAINNEEQYYVDSNGVDADKSYSPFTVANGELTITADLSSNSGTDVPPAALPSPNDPVWIDHPEFQQGPYAEAPKYTSGIITSYDAFKFVNGYAEIRAKVPSGDGLWPAFWLLNAYYVGSLPEIDIMEILGEDPTRAYHTFHRSDVNGSPISNQYTSDATNPIAGYSDGFHTYGVRWQPGKITWYVDGQVVDTFEETDPNKNDAYQLMYVIANLAVGGQFNTLPVDDSAIPAEFVIDYIRVYQENDTP